jgi:galactokinase/mevalonate kinase-like predicted kinase
MLETDKTQELAKEIGKELVAAQAKLFQDEMRKMQDDMNKLKEELSKKVDDAISGKKVDEATSGKNENQNDGGSEIGAGEHGHQKGIYSSVNFDYSSELHIHILHPSTLASHLTLMEQDIWIGLTR